jgi:hypothetical protein
MPQSFVIAPSCPRYYVAGNGFGHFEPNSDAEFIEFKQLMKEEWARR